jgi:hypothetical protein
MTIPVALGLGYLGAIVSVQTAQTVAPGILPKARLRYGQGPAGTGIGSGGASCRYRWGLQDF